MNNDDKTNANFTSTQVEAEGVILENKDITTFHNDAGVRDTTVTDEVRVTSAVFDGSEQATDLSIITFLERPKILVSGSLANTDVYGNIGGAAFADLYMPLYGLQGSTMLQAKLQGILGVRYDLEFEIVVNCTRFAQGLYAMYFCYTGGGPERTAIEWKAPHIATYVQRSQLPHVKIDLNCDTRATLKIPWCSAYGFTPMADLGASTIKNIGHLGYLVFCPYVTTGTSTALYPSTESGTFTIYWRMTNIKLIGASAAPQMDLSESEAKSKSAGPIESMSLKISKAADLFTSVPLVSDYARGLSWASNLMAKTANVFGWARPANDSTMVRVKRKPLAYLSNVDTLDNSDPMALTSTNKVEVLPGFVPTNVDELDFKVFCSKFSVIGGFSTSWATSALVGDALASFPVTPCSTLLSPPFVYSLTPLQYTSTLFKEWRGSIVYKIRFVKTEFHSGRIAICFNPSVQDKTAYNTSNYQDYTYREVIDLRYCNEFTFSIPYVSISPYLPTQILTAPPVEPYVGQTITTATGTINIFVVDRLKAPPNVHTSVPIIIEHCGGNDIEFANPRAIRLLPKIDVTPQMDMSDCSDVAKPIGNMTIPTDKLDYAKAAIGERIINFRSLLKRFTAVYPTKFTEPTANCYQIRPWCIQWYDSGHTSETDDGINGPDLYGQLGSIFLLSRGSVRFKYVNPRPCVIKGASETHPTSNPLVYAVYNEVELYDRPTNASNRVWLPYIAPSTIRMYMSNNNLVVANPNEEYGVEISVPQYSLTHSRPNAELRTGGRYLFPQTYHQFSSALPAVNVFDITPIDDTYSINGTDVFQPYFMRAGGEDTNFGMFVSIPPMAFTKWVI